MAQAALENQKLDTSEVSTATPLLGQYLAIKAQHPDSLLFFRLGDFYELFFEDAITAAKALDITLTRRGQFQGKDVPMCGVPFHAYENYMAKLIRKGHHVAICEQVETPESAKKRGSKSIVERKVVRIITPGTVTEDNLLDARTTNFLACIGYIVDEITVVWIDLATSTPYIESVNISTLTSTLARLSPSELIISDKAAQTPRFLDAIKQWQDVLTILPAIRFDTENCKRRILETYGISEISAFGDFSRSSISALGTLLDYLSLTQKRELAHLCPPQNISSAPLMIMDGSTRRNLELMRTLTGERRGSLLATIDYTLTNAGARLLSSRLSSPITDTKTINAQLDTVEFLLNDPRGRERLRHELSNTPDMQRALARLSLGRGGPRDLAGIRDSLKQAATVRSILLPKPSQSTARLLLQSAQSLGSHEILQSKLEQALADELPLHTRDGGYIAKGFSAQLDEYLSLRDNSRRLVAALQQKYITLSGTTSLKIKHNNIIGYFIEVSPAQADNLLLQKDVFIHRQSLVSATRFTTVELSELEQKISESATKAIAIEIEIFNALVGDIIQNLSELRATAQSLAEIDVYCALAELAFLHKYVRPKIDDSLAFHIIGGRHPVVERATKNKIDAKPFVQNSCDLSPPQRIWLLTGPNMAGKSTFLRQNALIAILAQIGSFVPAEHAHIGVIDKLFSRVGAADDLARGQSTFMVEMVETATILNQASERSLVILDEIGRGTATYDGLSIAWASLEHLHENNKCRTLFATHYHELTTLEKELSNLICATVKIKEWENEIIFLHEVIAGTADRSYGIHVAKMAGLPKSVILRAELLLSLLESEHKKANHEKMIENLPLFSTLTHKSEPKGHKSEIESAIRSLNLDELSPKEALDELYRIRNMILS